MIRTIVVEDEPIARRGLIALLSRHPDLSIVAECESARTAAAAVRAHRPDLLFLDIHLPVVNGFASVDGIADEARPVIIVTTAHTDYALHAYQRGVLSYLVKPLSESAVDDAVSRARLMIHARRTGGAHEYASRLAVRVEDGMILLRTADIDWIQADDDNAWVHVGGHAQLVRERLGDLERTLDPQQFVRVHRSAIVNIDRVTAIRPELNGRYTIVLASGARVLMSKARRGALAAALGRDL